MRLSRKVAYLPREFGCSGTTAWRRLRDWQAAGAWERLHKTPFDRLNGAGAIDWSASVVDGSHIRALQRGPRPGRLPLTVAERAPSITCWSTRPASRWRSP